MSRLFLFFVLCVHCVWCNDQEIGDVCQTSEADKKSGICIPLDDCGVAIDGLNAKPRKNPTVCSFRPNSIIVCCPNSSSSLTATTLKRVEKCQKYSQYVFEKIEIPAFRPGSKPTIIKKNRCGRDGAPFIIGGVTALPREYPHSALLGYQFDGGISWECGGSLVSSRYVLTAGHCLNSPNNGPVIKVRLGELDYSKTTDDATPKDFNIDKIISHPDYKPSSKYNDIALLKLSETVKLSPYIRPICLPTENIEPDEYIATGWGYTMNFGKGNAALLKVKLQSFAYEDCKESYSYFISRKLRNGLQPTQLCAGHRTEMRDTCNGDSGGPLQIYHPSVACSSIQIGITSFGIECASVNFPAIYTRVFEYADWIENVIWAPGEDF